MSTIAFLGLGGMGSRMAARLLDVGHDLIVWNRTAEKAESLAAAGARVARTPAEAARDAELTITMLATPDALRAVASGPDGFSSGVRPGATVVEMSTVGPDTVRWLAAVLPTGVHLLDAPVLGSVTEAESGRLKVFVGGPDDLVERWRSLLGTFGPTTHVGPLESGAKAKLVANSTLLGVLSVLGEALELAGTLGLELDKTFDVLAATPLAAQAERRRPAVESGDYPKRFSLSLAVKDADLVRAAGASTGADLRVAETVRTWFAEADAAGLGDRDYSAILEWIMTKPGRLTIAPPDARESG
ncbi:MAG TPA: NAD(P)-dependent oxidoreductase [Actinopolymorphaceae bacterium]